MTARVAAPNHIDPSAYLDELLAQAVPDLMRQMLQDVINQILSTQAGSVCGAGYATVSDTPPITAGGYRHRGLDTRVATCYLTGVSARRMNGLVATCGITNLSKPLVPSMATELDVMVEDFRTRPLDVGAYFFRFLRRASPESA